MYLAVDDNLNCYLTANSPAMTSAHNGTIQDHDTFGESQSPQLTKTDRFNIIATL